MAFRASSGSSKSDVALSQLKEGLSIARTVIARLARLELQLDTSSKKLKEYVPLSLAARVWTALIPPPTVGLNPASLPSKPLLEL